MNILLKAAINYKNCGFSVIPIDNSKKSIFRWRQFQKKLISNRLLYDGFNQYRGKGIAIICGKISDNLEVIDIDSKYDLDGKIYHKFIARLDMQCPNLTERLVIAQTKNGGYHLFYRCQDIDGNLILAKRPATEKEKSLNPFAGPKALIETRGEGGYVIVNPTYGYHFLQHNLELLPVITPEEKRTLILIAQKFDQCREEEKVYHHSPSSKQYSNSPFDDYNKRGDVIKLLQKHGWIVVKDTAIRTFFRRPGDTDHDTSGDYNHVMGLFGVFSSSTDFKVKKGYKPYQVYAILECNSNFKLAAKQLLGEGFGIPYSSAMKQASAV